MKSVITFILAGIILLSCNSRNNSSSGNQVKNNGDQIATTARKNSMTESVSKIHKIIESYLALKNALAEDKTDVAADAGKTLENAFKTMDKSALTEAQKKTYEDVEEDATESAEHIGKNSGNIKHQREHFEMLSQDIYDLVKTFGAGQTLYKDFCPMYNNGKGAFWLSDVKEIKNPYLGKSMPTCGNIKEELH